MSIMDRISYFAIPFIFIFLSAPSQSTTFMSGEETLPSPLAEPEVGELYSFVLIRLRAAGWNPSNSECSLLNDCNDPTPKLKPVGGDSQSYCRVFENGYSKAKICGTPKDNDFLIEKFEYER